MGGLPVLLLAQPELVQGQGPGIGNHHGYRVAAPADDHLGKFGGGHEGGQVARISAGTVTPGASRPIIRGPECAVGGRNNLTRKPC